MVSCEGIALLFLILGGMGLISRRSLARRRRLLEDKSKCARCGYDLTGNQSGRCPECGLDSRLISTTVANEVRRDARRLIWLLTAMLCLLFIGFVSPGLALLAAAVCGVLWVRHLPRFAAWRCQICGESLVGVGDGRCTRCGQTAGEEAERVLQAELRRRRRPWNIGIATSMLVILLVSWLVSVKFRITLEFANQWLILGDGSIEYVTPAHDDWRLETLEFRQEYIENSELPLTKRYGLTLPRAMHFYGAMHILVPLWVATGICGAVAIRSLRAKPGDFRMNPEAERHYVRFPSKRRSAILSIVFAALFFAIVRASRLFQLKLME